MRRFRVGRNFRAAVAGAVVAGVAVLAPAAANALALQAAPVPPSRLDTRYHAHTADPGGRLAEVFGPVASRTGTGHQAPVDRP